VKPKEFHIWDFPDNVYIDINQSYKRKLYQKLEEQYKNMKSISEALNYYPSSIREFFIKDKKKKFLPNNILKTLIKLFPDMKDTLESNIKGYRGTNGYVIKNPKLPLIESPELYNVVMHLLGDGSFEYYSNTCKELRQEFRKNLRVFGNFKTIERLLHTRVYIIKFPRIISHILEHIFNIDIVRPNRLPKILFDAPLDCRISAIRTIFDDEGSVSIRSKYKRYSLSITSSSKRFINDIKNLLKSVEIISGKVTKSEYGKFSFYQMNVLSESHKKFINNIGFTHPEKLKKFSFILKYKQRFRTIENKICSLIQKQPRDRYELSKILNYDIDCLTYFIYKLRKQGRIKSSFNGRRKPYLWTMA
jgi:hypothetical protein